MTSLFGVLAGPLLWLASFSAIYGLQGLSCAAGWDQTPISGLSLARVLLLMAWITAVAAQTALLAVLYSRRFDPPSPLVRWVSRAGGWTGLVAAVWTLFPIVVTSTCG